MAWSLQWSSWYGYCIDFGRKKARRVYVRFFETRSAKCGAEKRTFLLYSETTLTTRSQVIEQSNHAKCLE
jgi:hypothetical protein